MSTKTFFRVNLVVEIEERVVHERVSTFIMGLINCAQSVRKGTGRGTNHFCDYSSFFRFSVRPDLFVSPMSPSASFCLKPVNSQLLGPL